MGGCAYKPDWGALERPQMATPWVLTRLTTIFSEADACWSSLGQQIAEKPAIVELDSDFG